MKIITIIARLVVAVTFVFSGFVKLVDPLGSAYKFEEYFSSGVLNIEFLIPYALPFAILLILAEIMLGVMLLVGYLPKITVWSLVIIMLVFLFLTWYSAFYDKVTDCGCFGDAVKLTAWETFYKNVVLIVLVFVLLLRVKHIKPMLSVTLVKWISFGSFLVFLYIMYYALVHLPIIDFRPYAIGKNIPEGMKHIGETPPPIHDFYLENLGGEEVTTEVLEADKALLVIAYNLSKSDKQGFSAIKNVTDEALNKNYVVYLLTSSMDEEYFEIQKEFNLKCEMLFCDETALKTIIRSNPGILMLEKGTVTGKWSWTDANEVFGN